MVLSDNKKKKIKPIIFVLQNFILNIAKVKNKFCIVCYTIDIELRRKRARSVVANATTFKLLRHFYLHLFIMNIVKAINAKLRYLWK